MENVKKSAVELIGNTPLLELGNYSRKNGLKARVIAKVEYLIQAGSVKDRIALAMIEDAEQDRKVKEGGHKL